MKFELFLTENAKKFLSSKLGDNKSLKIGLKPSGCAGYSYLFDYSEKKETDKVFQKISFDIAKEDEKNLQNSIIDYKKEGVNYKLVIDNPNSTHSCGCGESFNLKEVK